MVDSRESCGTEEQRAVSGERETQMLMRGYSFKISAVILLLVAVCLFSFPAEVKYGGGTGEPNDPYLIADANHMQAIGADANDWDKCFKLIADIDLSDYTGTEFNIIGYYAAWNDNVPFSGVFNGNGHSILNFTYDVSGLSYPENENIGLFSFVYGFNAEIKNLGLIDPNVYGGNVGALVGWFDRGDLRNCHVKRGMVAGTGGVGGLVGRLDRGNLSNCYVRESRVAGSLSVGGLVGRTYSGTITSCSSSCIVEGREYVGGLLGRNLEEGAITDCHSAGSVEGKECIGGLVGKYRGSNAPNPSTITNCYSTCDVNGISSLGGLVGSITFVEVLNCFSTGDVTGEDHVGGLVGYSYYGNLSDCSATGSVEGRGKVGGLVGHIDMGTISNCCWIGDRVAGSWHVGGLAGYNKESYSTSIIKSFATGNVEGQGYVGGLVGENRVKLANCYANGDVHGDSSVGGLVGRQYFQRIDNCYSTGEVTGDRVVGGLVGLNSYAGILGCFWDVNTSGQTDSDGGTGKNTDEMQTMSTFGWDFTTPLWTINEGVDYPRLWWEFVPVLDSEPEISLGTSNTISWDPIPGVNDFYAECAEDANFTSIVYNSGWIAETSFEFTGLESGRQYWYSVKARNELGEECQWSNVETSLQGTLADVVEIKLGPGSLKNNNMQKTLLNKINAAQEMIDQGLYEDALRKLEHDILAKMDGCSETGEPDKNDWIITCEDQAVIYPLVKDTIEHVRSLME